MAETTTPETPATATRTAKPRKARKAAAKPESNGRARKDGIRLPQWRILNALKNGKRLTRNEIIEKISQGDKPTAVGFALGPVDPKMLKEIAKQAGFPSLLMLKFVRMVELDVEGKIERTYEITAAGRKAHAGYAK